MYTVIVKSTTWEDNDAALDLMNATLQNYGYLYMFQIYERNLNYIEDTVKDLLNDDDCDLIEDCEMFTNDDVRVYKAKYFRKSTRFKWHRVLIIQIADLAVATQLKLSL
jgi:hypothetical protein